MVDGAQVSLVTLEKALMQYVHEPSSAPFDLNSVPLAAPPEERSAASGGEGSVRSGGAASAAAMAAARLPATATRQDVFIEKLQAIPQFAAFGPLFKSSAPIEMTDSISEIVVQCVKHTFAQHIVLQVRLFNSCFGRSP